MTRQEIVPELLIGATAVVFDVLLATTTLLRIVEQGARRVYPVANLEQASARRDSGPGPWVMGGEQQGSHVSGFDLGHMPWEYSREIVAGKDVIFVSTNGTPAISAAEAADRLLLGCLRNAPAVARYLDQDESEEQYLICAGSRGHTSLEDFMGVATVLALMTSHRQWDDAALIARDLGHLHLEDAGTQIAQGRVGRWLTSEGNGKAVTYAAQMGASDTLLAVKNGCVERV